MPDNNDEYKKYLDYDGLAYLLQRFPKTTVHCTFDDEFAGETATLTHGTTTYTKTVPATSPFELTFAVNELGTWTLQSSYLGTQYSDTVDITYLGQKGEIELTIVPDGSTIEPINSISIWLKCANLNKSYSTLAEVLADTETFETLISDSNACQYMKRSTGWAGDPTVKVPTMTSNTTPSGEAFASSTYSSSYPAYYAFDGNNTTFWSSQSSGDQYVGYKFTSAVNINKLYMYPNLNSGTDYEFKLQGSNDNSTWTDLKTFEIDGLTPTYIDVNSNNSYMYYRVLRDSGWQAFTVQFYQVGITTSQDAMARLGKFGYASDTLISDSTWKTAIENSDYWDEVFKDKVPQMTSNTTPKGEVFTLNSHSSYTNLAWSVFNGGRWCDADNSTNSAIGYKFTKPFCIERFTTTFASGRIASAFVINASNDGTNWVELYRKTGNSSVTIDEKIDNSEYYLYYRLYKVTGSSSYNTMYIDGLQFYGRSSEEVLVPLVPTMTSNTTPSGVCSADTEYSTYLAWKAFDGSTASSDGWIANSGSFPHWIKYEFPSAIKVNAAGFRNINGNHAYAIKNYKIQGSNDNESWIDLYAGINNNNSNNDLWTVNFDNSTAYKYYRLYIIDGWSSNPNYRCDIGYIQFYAKTVQTNIIHSTPNDTIYMLEDGDPLVLATTNSDGDGILDFSQLPAGPVTLYSSVAKNPEDLTADYSKTITITKTQYGCTTEVYLMPDTVKTLYWWGNENNTGGWTERNSNSSNARVVNYNTNNIGYNINSGAASLGTNKTINTTNCTKICGVVKTTNGGINLISNISMTSSPQNDYYARAQGTVNNTMEYIETDLTNTGNVYTYIFLSRATNVSSNTNTYSIWYE